MSDPVGPVDPVEHVYDLMARAEDLPYGEAKTVLMEDALRRAEMSGDEVLAYRVRMHLTGGYQHGGEPAKAFTTFSRCLAEHDRDPGRFQDGSRLLWHFKWIVNSLTEFPEIPLDRTYAVLDDMERRYRLSGHSLQAVYHYRHVVARHIGDREAADEWYERWHAAPRDMLSDCEGCDPTGKVRHLTSRGRHQDALDLAGPVLRAELNCTEQPQNILTALLPCYLSTGRLEEGRDAHRRAYRLARSNIRELGDIAEHVEFCARTGNEARGLEILERHLGWFDRAPSPHAAMRFAAAGALLLRRIAETGLADPAELTVRRGDADVPAARLATEFTDFALATAGRFDARNGTSHQGDRVREVLAAEPIVDHLPLTPYARRPVPAPPPEAAPALADDPIELLDRAEELWRRREVAAARACWRRFDELDSARGAGSDPATAGRRADARGFELLLGGDPDGALAEWERAAALHAEAGDELRVHSTRSRTGATLCGIGRAEEGLALIRDSLAALDERAPGSDRAISARLRLATAYGDTGHAEEALTLLEGVTVTGPLDTADLDMARARTLAHLGRDEDSMAALRTACAGYREAEAPGSLAEGALLLAQQLLRAGTRPEPGEEVLTLLDEAVAHAPADLPGLRPAAYATRGNRLLDHERFADAAEDLIEAVAAFTADQLPERAAYARLDLAVALLNTERFLEAAEVAEEAGPMLERLGDLDAERHSRFLLGQAQRGLGEEAAAGTFTALAAENDHPGGAGALLEAAADVLTSQDSDGLAAERFLAAAAKFAEAGEPYGVVRTRRRGAMCLSWSGRLDDGLDQMAQARAALADLPPDNEPARVWETALVSYDEARLLAQAARYDEARSRVAEAIAGFETLGEEAAANAARTLQSDLANARP